MPDIMLDVGQRVKKKSVLSLRQCKQISSFKLTAAEQRFGEGMQMIWNYQKKLQNKETACAHFKYSKQTNKQKQFPQF